jgi:peptide/nickel transport system substrate-binding protein
MRKTLRLAPLLAAVLALAIVAAGCGAKKSSSGAQPNTGSGNTSSANSIANYISSYDNGTPQKGGDYRVGWEQSFGFTDNFDPTGEYLGDAFGIYVNLLLRPLIGYKHEGGAAGNQLIGDLAASVPKPTDNGLTYTYHLRSGIKFGPPVNRVITSKDVAYALNRLADPKNGGQYAF